MDGGAARAEARGRRLRDAPWPRRVAGVLAVAVLGFVASGGRVGTTVDLYQFWAVGTARSVSPEPLPPPYTDPRPTLRVLDDHFAREPDPAVRALHAKRRAEFEPFGSPLLYASFAPLPDDYRAAWRIHRALQVVAFALGVLLLGRWCGAGLAGSSVAAALLALAYRPFGDDLFTGNVNALQLAGLAGACALARRRPAAACALLAALVLAKANLLWPALGVALAAGLRASGRARARVLAVATATAVAGVVVGLLYFRSPGVWSDWLGLVFGDPRRIGDYAGARGNVSPSRWLYEEWGLDPLVGIGLLAGALAVALLVALGRRAHHRGRPPLAVLAEPGRAASLGVLAMLALQPLVWFHYFVLALVPIAWLLRREAPPAARALGVVALFVDSAVYLPLAVWLGVHPALPHLWSWSWGLLAAGLALELAAPPEEGDEVRQASSRR